MVDPRLAAFLKAADADALVTADAGLVRMLTGHCCEIETGQSPFALAPIVVAPSSGEAVLVCSADEAPPGAEAYEGFTVGPLDPIGGAAGALARAFAGAGVSRIIVDGGTVPGALWPKLARPARDLDQLGAVKTPSEVEAIEASLRLCETGQLAAREATRAGASELEVWAAARSAIEREAGGRCALLADLVAGPRTGETGGAPSTRAMAPGEILLCDLVPRHNGIWGDSCATWAVTTTPRRARVLHAAAMAGLDAALAELRPGAIAGLIDERARSTVAAAGFTYQHHTGHGVGFHYHEEPRIVPGATVALEPGMVIALEPGAYEDGLGVRVEVVAVVTETGHRVLSRHGLGVDGGEGTRT